jgi:hypothetical protein
VCACALLAACEPLAIGLIGAGAGVALRYNLDNIAARTFTATPAAVKSASLIAIERMGLALDATRPLDSGELIVARARNREIEIELEPITSLATRMRITARTGGVFYDNATAHELVQQTEKILDAGVAAKFAPVAPAVPALTSN